MGYCAGDSTQARNLLPVFGAQEVASPWLKFF
jgi:hypothetical protein